MALFSFRTLHKSCIASAVQPTGTEYARLMYLGNPGNIGKSRKPCWQCRETVGLDRNFAGCYQV
jgi:hypothetical protein